MLPLGEIQAINALKQRSSIFSLMTQLATAYGAVNLAQGFPDFPVSESLLAHAYEAMKKGENQYCPTEGVHELRSAIADKWQNDYGVKVIPDEVTITSGATQAVFLSIMSAVSKGDEVLILDPAFDIYAPSVEVAGGIPVRVGMSPLDFLINWLEVKRLVSSRTKLVIVNNPHNPSGRCWREADFLELEVLAEEFGFLVLSDEVYHEINFVGGHVSVLSRPLLRDRSVVVGSLGKSMHVTGWRLGYAISSYDQSSKIRDLLKINTFCSPAPLQFAIARVLKSEKEDSLSGFFLKKRDRLLSSISSSRFSFTPSEGTYFQLLDYSRISDLDDFSFSIHLVKNCGISCIPLSSFGASYKESRMIRVCFAKLDETIDEASKILRGL